MARVKKPNLVRVGFFMSEGLKDFYREFGEEMGAPMSSVMILALKQYMDAQVTLKKMGGIELLAEHLKGIKLQEKKKAK